MKNLSIREKTLLALLLIFGIGYLYYTFVLNPLFIRIDETKLNIAGYNTQLDQIQTIIATNDEFNKDYNQLLDKFTSYSERVPYSVKDPEIAYKFKDIASKTASEIMSVTFGLGTQSQELNVNLIPIPVTASFVSDDYESAVKLVKTIEEDTRFVQVTSMSLVDNTTQTEENKNILVNLGLEYYYIFDGNVNLNDYQFNNGIYGKTDMFN